MASSLRCLCPGRKVITYDVKESHKPGTKPLPVVFDGVVKKARKGGVVLANFGLWFNTKADMQRLGRYMKRVKSSFLRLVNKKARFVWFTTTAQHFCNTGGRYAGGTTITGKVKISHCCAVRSPSTERQDIARANLIAPLGNALEVLGLFELSTPLHKMHPPGGIDCTHMCSNVNGAVHYFALKFLSMLVGANDTASVLV